MINLITGKIGGGKTLFVVNRALETFARGGFVMGNVHFLKEGCTEVLKRRYNRTFDLERQFKFHDFEAEPDFQENCYQGVKGSPILVIVDEAHLYYPSVGQMTQDKERQKLNSFLSQSRKVHIDMYFITQDISLLYHRIKAQAEHRFHCIDMRKKSLPFLGTMPASGLKWVEKDVKSEMVLKTGVTKLDRKIFSCYDSFQMYDSQMRELQASMPVFEPLDNKIPFVEPDSKWGKIWNWNPLVKTQSCA